LLLTLPSQDVRAQFAKEGKQITFGDAGKLIGEQWAKLTDTDKKKWIVRLRKHKPP
jgi:hypothetical protein